MATVLLVDGTKFDGIEFGGKEREEKKGKVRHKIQAWQNETDRWLLSQYKNL